MEDKKITYRIALSGDKKRWRVYGAGEEHLCDKVFIRTHQVETETREERERLDEQKDYKGPNFVIKAKGTLRKAQTKIKTIIIIE